MGHPLPSPFIGTLPRIVILLGLISDRGNKPGLQLILAFTAQIRGVIEPLSASFSGQNLREPLILGTHTRVSF